MLQFCQVAAVVFRCAECQDLSSYLEKETVVFHEPGKEFVSHSGSKGVY